MHWQGNIYLKQQGREGTSPYNKRQRLADGVGLGDAVARSDRAPIHGDARKMPGVMGKSEEGKTASSSENARDHRETKDSAMTDSLEELPRTNGVRPLLNGLHANGTELAPYSPQVQSQTPNAPEKALDERPPEIEHSSLGYLPMSRLVVRLVQETFNGLEDVINGMAEVPLPQPQINGNINHVNRRAGEQLSGDTSQANVHKKRLMFEFASSRRSQFIKFLVLSRWARQAEAIGKVIDVRLWLDQKDRDYTAAVQWIGELKRKMATAKEPKPDINTALEILSLGKSTWMPDLDYLPSEQLTPQQALAGLRKINVLLAIRLNLHESIPPVLRNFSIRSGRATFRVAEEFEVDLSIADEDHSHQLYFLDLRLIFTPAPPELPPGRLREEFENRANDVLSRVGLTGLYDYLHNIVLTHKLTILRTQAFEMARSHWLDHLKVEPVRRAVVVQYWCDRLGGKHWVEIGIARGKGKHIAYADAEQRISEIAIRWFRGGQEIQGVELDLRPGDLSMEYILKQVIARHTNYIFSEMESKLSQTGVYTSENFTLKYRKASYEPADACLLVQTTPAKAVKIIQEPVSGQLVVMPTSSLNSRAAFELNRLTNPASDGASQILYLRALSVQEEIEAGARRIGWKRMRSLNPPQETMQRLFPKGTQRTNFYRRDSWSAGWVLAFSTSLDGDHWWAVETSEQPTASDSTTLAAARILLRKAYRIMNGLNASSISESSSTSLSQVESAAVGVISRFSDTQYLASSRIPHKLQLAPSFNTRTESSIYARLPSRQAPSMLRSAGTITLPWAHEVVKIVYRGLSASHNAAIHIVSARLNRSFPSMKDLTINMPGAAFHSSSGAFALRLRTKIGETSIPQLKHRIDAVGRLHDFIAIINAYKLKVDRFTTETLEFTYQDSPEILKATINFPADAVLQLSLSPPSPHLRILDHLNSRLHTEGLAPVLALMRFTLPLLSSLAKLEVMHSLGGISVFVRSEQWYQVSYHKNSKASFDIQLRQRRDEPMWFIPEHTIKKPDLVGDEDRLQQSLREATRGRGEGWRGMSGGIVASLAGIEGAVEKLDAVLSSATTRRHTPEDSRPGKRKAGSEIVELD